MPLDKIQSVSMDTGVPTRAQMPAGSVLQVVSAQTITNTSSSSASYVDATGLTATITPTSATSKIFIMVDCKTYIQSDNSNNGGLRIMRDAVAVYTDDRAVMLNVNANIASGIRLAMNYLDSPATTSATTYKVQLQRTAFAGTSYPFSVSPNSSPSTITLMEIAA